MRLEIRILAVAVVTAACGTGVNSVPESTHNPDGGSPPSADSSTHSGNPTGSDSGSPSSNACPESPGPRHAWSTGDELEQLIVGRWVQCSQETVVVVARSQGLDITADGLYFLLFDDGQGGLTRRSGFENEGTWNVSGPTDTQPFLALWPTPNTEFLGPPMFEDGPRRFALGLYDGALAIYQQLPPE